MSRTRRLGDARRTWKWGLWLSLGVWAGPATAEAFQIDSIVTAGCHEQITRDALERVRAQSPELATIAAFYRFRDALVDTAPFDLGNQKELGAALLILANRDIDLEGSEPTDLERLAQVHGREGRQPLHCLRLPADDAPTGAQGALERCRQTIREGFETAVAALDDAGQPAAGSMETLRAYLYITGVTDVDIPAAHLAAGRALHTLQDGFTHTYRSPDGAEVWTVLNYTELVEAELDEARDGPPHSAHLDQCDDADDLRTVRRTLATEASARFLTLTFSSTMSIEQKRAGLEVLLDDYFQLREGCTDANGWCAAAEAEYKDPEPSQCSHLGVSSPAGWGLGMLLLLSFGLLRRCSRRSWRRRAVGVATLSLALGAAPGVAEASDWGTQLTVGGGFDDAGGLAAVGGRYRLDDEWMLGLDLEWNPWFGGTFEDVKPGALNLYASLVKRTPLAFEQMNLRSTVEVGVSRILFDVVGVAQGAIGPYLGINLLGLDWEIDPEVRLVLDPAHIAVPIPQIDGVPFAYVQYQLRLGVQFGATGPGPAPEARVELTDTSTIAR